LEKNVSYVEDFIKNEAVVSYLDRLDGIPRTLETSCNGVPVNFYFESFGSACDLDGEVTFNGQCVATTFGAKKFTWTGLAGGNKPLQDFIMVALEKAVKEDFELVKKAANLPSISEADYKKQVVQEVSDALDVARGIKKTLVEEKTIDIDAPMKEMGNEGHSEKIETAQGGFKGLVSKVINILREGLKSTTIDERLWEEFKDNKDLESDKASATVTMQELEQSGSNNMRAKIGDAAVYEVAQPKPAPSKLGMGYK
jgi:hypothetical protein